MLRNLEEEEENLAAQICSYIGTMISIGLNLTPILLFYRYFKKKARLETIPEMMFVSGICGCGTLLAYSFLIDKKILIISNGVCYGLQVLYGTTYIFIRNSGNVLKLLLYLIITWNLSFQPFYFFYDVLAYFFGQTFAVNFTGSFNTFIGVVNVITPGQNIVKVFRTSDFTLIPIVTIFFQCACSTFWFVYALTIPDTYMIIQNLIGVVITFIQIATYYYFYCKLHGIPPEIKKEEGEGEGEIEQQKNGETAPLGISDDKPDNEQKLMADE